MLRVHLIRHGRTDWNARGLYQGHIDTKLDAYGHLQAKHLATRLATCEPPAQIIHSDLARAAQTASHVSQALGCPSRADARLREVQCGAFEGLERNVIEARWPGHAARFRVREVAAPGGEPLDVAQARVRAAWDDMLRDPCEVVAVISHGFILRLLLADLFDVPAGVLPPMAPMTNTAITTLELRDETVHLIRANDTRHVPAPPESATHG